MTNVLLSALGENSLTLLSLQYLYHGQYGNPFLIHICISVELLDFFFCISVELSYFSFFVSVELLEIQDQYAKDVIQYLQVLDPGRTWRKSQILSKLRVITTALAKVSSILIFMTYFLLHFKNRKINQCVSKKVLMQNLSQMAIISHQLKQ